MAARAPSLLPAEGGIRADGPPASVLTERILRRYFKVEARIGEMSHGAGLSIEPLAARTSSAG